MKDLILGFPNQIKESVRIGKVQCLKTNNSEIKNVVFCGLGGSGIGGRIVSQWIEHHPCSRIIKYHGHWHPRARYSGSPWWQ